MVEVIVPWLGGCPYRKRAWEWLAPRYEWPVWIGVSGVPFCKAEAVMPAIERSSAEIIVVADADVWTDGLQLAIEAVRRGAAWALPHKGVHRLSEEGTEAVLAGELWLEQPREQRGYRGTEGGGIVVARRDVLLDVPMDARFVGWGGEDFAWGLALRTLAGPPWRGKALLMHLWHPPQERFSRRWGSTGGKRLAQQYSAASGFPDRMRELVEEGRKACLSHSY